MNHILFPDTYWDHGTTVPSEDPLIVEEPLSIRIQGKPYAVVMRTPGDELAHAAGFCLTEGIVNHPDDFSSIGFCDEIDKNTVTITLDSDIQKQTPVIDRKSFVSQTSCGICGKAIIEDLFQMVSPMAQSGRLNLELACRCLESLSDHQPLRALTRASHAAAIFSRNMQILAAAEDVGRHNALDKAIGKLFLEKRLAEAGFIILSSRISFELVQKAARARIPVILALSRPTALAVELAKKLSMTLGCRSKQSGLILFCGNDRLDFNS